MKISKGICLTMITIANVGANGCGSGGHGDGHDGHVGDDAGLAEASTGGVDVQGNTLFVALGLAGSVAVVDVDAWKLAGTLQLSDKYFPHHLSLSPDRTRIAIGAPASDLSGGHAGHGASVEGALYVLDSRTGAVVAQAMAGGTAHNLAYLSDGKTVAFALMEHGAIHFASAQDLSVTGTVTVGTAPLEATPAPMGDAILVANSGDGTISVVDVATMMVSKTLMVGANPIGAWLGANGRAYATSESDKKLSAIDLTSLAVAKTVDLPGTPGQAIAAAGGQEVWVAIEDLGKVAVFGSADLASVTDVTVGVRPHGLVPSPDGKSIYLTDESAGEIFELNVETHAISRRLTVGGAPNGILYRPTM